MRCGAFMRFPPHPSSRSVAPPQPPSPQGEGFWAAFMRFPPHPSSRSFAPPQPPSPQGEGFWTALMGFPPHPTLRVRSEPPSPQGEGYRNHSRFIGSRLYISLQTSLKFLCICRLVYLSTVSPSALRYSSRTLSFSLASGIPC